MSYYLGKTNLIVYNLDIESTFIQESKSKVVARSIECVIKKAEKKWWDRLIKQEGKPPGFLKFDWDKWVEEEDENGNCCRLFLE